MQTTIHTFVWENIWDLVTVAVLPGDRLIQVTVTQVPLYYGIICYYRMPISRRAHEVENASFTPLIFTTTGGMGDAATQFYKRLANLLSAKHSLSYGIVMGWLRCKLSFSLLRSAIMCIRGARSSLRCPIAEALIAVQVAEAHM